MKPVNSLPTFVSQDTDLKTKDSSSSFAGRKKDTDFSSMVDQHLNDGSKEANSKETSAQSSADTAKNGQAIADNEQNNSEPGSSRQESDSVSDSEASANTESSDPNRTSDENNTDNSTQKSTEQASFIDNQESDAHTDKEAAKDEKTLAESEQFIALLYNSDQTLTNPGDKTKQAEQVKQSEHSNNQQIKPVTYSEKSDSNNKQGVTAGDESNKSAENNASIAGVEHKLKAFSTERDFSAPQSELLLKDYRQSLLSQQHVSKGQSISTEQLANTQFSTIQQKDHHVAELVVGDSIVKSSLQSGSEEKGLYQLPVEPIGKGKTSNEEKKPSTEQLAVNNIINDNKPDITTDEINGASVKQSLDGNQGVEQTKVGIATQDSLKSSGNGELQGTVLKVDAENNANKATQNISAEEKTSNVKGSIEQGIQASNVLEGNSKTSQRDSQTKNSAMTASQLQQQLAQAQQKSASDSSEQQSSAEAPEDFVDAMAMTADKPVEQGVKASSKSTDNVATRSVSEIQNQAVQANQNKQSNDAYIDHQTNEILNHTVASDTAQIQKNNVLLQQETIAIFRKDFADAVKDKVMIMINQKLQQFDITLDPPEFGNMQVRVNLQGEQAAVNFVVQNQQAKEALEQNMHKLKDMLAEQGVDVGGANVEQQEQQQNNDENLMASGESSSSLSESAEEENSVQHTLSASLFESSATGVDYYA